MTARTTLQRFAAIPSPCPAELAALERMPPYSPFNTAAYASARERMGERAFVLGVWHDREPREGCLALMAQGRITRRLSIPSLPRLDSPELFFDGLLALCRHYRILDLEIGTFGSNRATIPVLGPERDRRLRWEFVLDLSVPDPMAGWGSNHRRSAKRAVSLGATWRRGRCERDALMHLDSMTTSLERRRARGEKVAVPGNASEFRSLIGAGVGEIFQAMAGDQLLASILVLKSGRVAYYHSAGTTPKGMRAGASPFLIGAAATELARAGIIEFNLGGAEPENAGLFRFKSGFGCTVRELESATFSLTNSPRLRLQAALRSAAHDPRGMAARLLGWRVNRSPDPAGSSR